MSKRVWYADILRIIAIVMVVVIHVASKDFKRVPIDSGHWQLLNAVNGLSRVAVPILFMVSGMFFLDPQKEVTINKLYRKNIWRLVRIFLFWSVIYVLFDRLIDAQPLLEGEVEKTILEIVQGYFHLWFLYRLVEVYILVPILRMVSKEKIIMIYFLLISFIVGFLIPTVKQFPIRSTDTIIDNGLNLDITIGYAGYMMLGYALHRYSLPDKWKRWIYFAGIVGMIVTVGGTSWISLSQNKPFDLLYEYLTPNVLVSSIALFLYIKEKHENKTFTMTQEAVIRTFSTYSFGVYLTHVLIRNVIWKGGLNTTIFTPVLSIPFLTILILFISISVTGVFMQIPLLKKTVT